MRVSPHLPPVLVALPLIAACASQSGVQNAPLHAGVGRTFQAPFERILTLTRQSIVEADLQIESANQVDDHTWMIMAKAGTSAFSWGEIVRCVVQRESPTATTVRVYTQRKSAVNITAKGDYSQSILSNIDLKLQSS